jgi:O-methyltransferase involved in polyketide biosynthesis
MSRKIGIEEGSIEETMLGPLWARATYSKLFPNLLDDQKAIEIIDNVEYDFSEMDEILGEWRAVGLMIRARRFDEALKNYMEKYPNATVINVGAGLDTTFFRVDNGSITMYNLDLPDVINLREELIPETERNQNLSQSVFNDKWMNSIEYSLEKGIFFIAGGFVYYFEENIISSLFGKLANRFPKGEIVFDAISNLALKKMNKKAEKADSELRVHLAINDPYETIPKWSEKIAIKDCFVIGDHTSVNKEWKLKTRIMNRVSNWLKTARIIHLQFQS